MIERTTSIRRPVPFAWGFGLAALLVLALAGQSQAVGQEALARGIPTLAPMLEEISGAVVEIVTAREIPAQRQFSFRGNELPEGLRRYFENFPEFSIPEGPRPFRRGAGSGVIVDAGEGFVVTNHHVIDQATSVTVRLSDGRSAEAELLGSDASTDLALLRIELDDLVEIAFADIETVRVGDFVVALGNPFGIGQTATSGIVSALGRSGLNNNNYEDFIQTDAAINVGNSGGALVDLEGNLVGINTAIISGSGGGNNGIGFAVPVNMVQSVMEHLERDGEVRRGLLGVSIADVTPELAEALALETDSGAVVMAVSPDSGAEAAGVEVSDVIVELDGEIVGNSRELRNKVGLMLQGEEVEIALLRDGRRVELDAVIGAADGRAVAGVEREPQNAGFRGALLRDADSNLSGALGVEVTAVQEGSRAWSAGLRAGDLIVAVNRRAVESLAGFNQAIEEAGDLVGIIVLREGREMLLLMR
ncbi:MAG: Do family serine endopeptidase [Gammaproteobacteria bacterium]|nr:Do family serine endopeptidase [Gammaproteobacteria bacterium]MDE0508324.1 Do family serine endopeptidase [Gammaproteobacteria bacterium]